MRNINENIQEFMNVAESFFASINNKGKAPEQPAKKILSKYDIAAAQYYYDEKVITYEQIARVLTMMAIKESNCNEKAENGKYYGPWQHIFPSGRPSGFDGLVQKHLVDMESRLQHLKDKGFNFNNMETFTTYVFKDNSGKTIFLDEASYKKIKKKDGSFKGGLRLVEKKEVDMHFTPLIVAEAAQLGQGNVFRKGLYAADGNDMTALSFAMQASQGVDKKNFDKIIEGNEKYREFYNKVLASLKGANKDKTGYLITIIREINNSYAKYPKSTEYGKPIFQNMDYSPPVESTNTKEYYRVL